MESLSPYKSGPVSGCVIIMMILRSHFVTNATENWNKSNKAVTYITMYIINDLNC